MGREGMHSNGLLTWAGLMWTGGFKHVLWLQSLNTQVPRTRGGGDSGRSDVGPVPGRTS